MEEKDQKQQETVYREFNQHWKNLKEYSVISKMIMAFRDRPIIKIVSDLHPEKILDVGCGIGRTMLNFKKNGFNVTGIDNSEASIRMCEKKGLKINEEIFQMNAASTKFANNSFDLVFSEGLLEHFQNYEPFAKEMLRVSKKYVLLLQPNFHSICGRIINFTIENFTKNNVKEIPYKIENYIKTFERHGSRIKKMQPAFFNSFVILLFEKKQ